MATTASRVEAFRTRKNEYFGTSADSPIANGDRETFSGLKYYPERPDLALELPLDTSGEGIGERLEIPASDGALKPYLRAGRVHFEVEGNPVTLSVFTDLNRGRFFLPFKDKTNGKETYGAGRYLDPKARPDGTLVVDFNYAYNPYCAYSEGWTCPVPPLENMVKVEIPAGEKSFKAEEPYE